MNIDQWIEGLEHANPPSESPLSVDQPHALRKRGRGSRKSSLLEPFPSGERRDINDELPIISVGSSSSGTSNATSISTSSFSSSSSSSSSNNKYQKRPRHHTKADKYHLKSKSKAKPEKRKQKKEEKEKEKRPKHNSRKKHKSKPVTGLVQTFQAKNVPKDRLTVSHRLYPLLKTIAETVIYSLILEPNLGYIPKAGPQFLPEAKAVRYEHSV
jgi:hypothetical protein